MSKNKKIGVIIEDPRIGGPHKQIIYFANSLKKNELSKVDLTFFLPNTLNNFIIKKNFKIVKLDISYLNMKNFFSFFINFIFDIKKIIYLFRKHKIDIIYVAGGILCFKTILSSIILKKKIIWHIHDTNSNVIIKLIFNILSFFIDKIIFVSLKSQKYYQQFFIDKKNLIINSSIDLKYFRNLKKKSFRNKTFKITVVANINPDKDIITLINVANEISKKTNKIIINIYGKVWDSQKKYFENCKNLIKKYDLKNICFHKKENNIKKIYKNSDVLLCTSRNESLPLVVCESMAMGLPIYSTDVGDIKKYIEFSKRKSGKIFKIGDYKTISNEILKIYQDRNNLKIYSRNSRFIAEKFFNILQYKKKILDLLNSK